MAFSSSSVLFRLICPKGFAGYCAIWFHQRGVRTATTVVRNQYSSSSPWLMLSPEFEGRNQYSSSSPWLMLSPEFEGSYKFYSLAQKKVQTPSPSDVISNLRLRCRGSSHGWLALLSPDNDVFFLYNPISRRHIELPSDIPKKPLDDIISSKDVSKVILSSSPDEESCRAVMINGCSTALAFCCPGRSNDWTTLMCDDNKTRYYIDCVYSTRRKVLFGLTMDSIETWNLGDPSSPRLIKINNIKTLGYRYQYYDFFSLARYSVGTLQHLVVAEQDLLFVIQYIMDCVGPDGSCFAHLLENHPDNCHHLTIGFDIYKYDPKKRCLKYVDSSSLGGLAIFLGTPSHSVAIPATQFPELKPNSIYFTEPYYIGEWDDDLYDDKTFSGHDIGVYSYEDKTVSPCYYPCDVRSLKKIFPSPVWFFPSRTV